jgi:uncharacterized membrane protein
MVVTESAPRAGVTGGPAAGGEGALAGHRAGPLLAHLPAVAIGLAWFALVSWIVLAEHATFNSTSRDIGVYLQVLWNTAHGHPFQTTLLESNRLHVAEHVALLLPFLAPVFALAPDVRWLLLAQQATLTLSGIPIYLLARRRLGGVWLPTLVVAAFYAMPTLDEIAFDAFYPVSFTALPIAFSGYFLLTGRWRAGVVCALVALLLEEEAGLTVVGLGAFLLMSPGGRRWAPVLLVVGVLWLSLVALVVMPRFHDPSTVRSGADNRTVGHFAQLRQRPAEVFGALLTERIPLAARWLLAPTGGLALLAPEVLLIDAPHAATLLLADNEGRYRRHWAAPMLPIIWLATVAGLARLRRPPLRIAGIAILVVGGVGSYLADSSLPGGGDHEPEDVVWTDRAEQLSYVVRAVPPGVSVAASRRMFAYLADRPELYVFPPSYAGKLWPPDRRVQAYALDLTNDQTYESLAGRQSPLRANHPYALWLAGPDAALLIDRPPPPERAVDRDLAGIRLLGYDARQDGLTVDLTLHWQAPARPSGPLTRQAKLLDGTGVVLGGVSGLALDPIFPTDEWPPGQVVLDRVRLALPGTGPLLLEVGWSDGGTNDERWQLPLADILEP